MQCRLGSTRLPNKALMSIGGKPMLQRVIDRVSQAALVENVIVATSSHKEDDALVDYCNIEGISVFRGDLDDVLSRFASCIQEFDLDSAVRITADDPLKDPKLIDDTIKLFENKEVDYASNNLVETFPEGLDVEVFSARALMEANEKATKSSDREHVTPYIKSGINGFHLANLASDVDYSGLRWTVDYQQDLDFVTEIYKHFEPRIDFTYHEVLNLLSIRPDISKINFSVAPRNEGYIKSLNGDKK